ncbi:MAG: 2-oxoacid:ferredoxin oxidoreductase subunit beta [Propionibacteriaceae bacterium]|jgi:2-oxoglutarate ferredoxin oxidoreductase subunit beta|nr:2-oxoacid:ferredoxin oxidoreductase subunit beta [Propionibacteriaceae bacterium]
MSGLDLVPQATTPTTRKDYVPANEVRWCPGCGDYSILATFQSVLPELGIPRENIVVVSGIGCSSRFPYYVDTYGVHSIHGRAPAIASGLAISRPDLSVFVVSGDGDALSIGGNHLIHALRRNMNLTILLLNNQIYGLTKGQYSPTSPLGSISKSSPFGSPDYPFDPVTLALGCDATFVARALDTDRAGLSSAILAGARHEGASLIEVYQNCMIFNDGAFAASKGPDANVLPLVDGEPLVWGEFGLVRNEYGQLVSARVAEVGIDAIVKHDPHRVDATQAFALSRLKDSVGASAPVPMGIFRDVERPSYEHVLRDQAASAHMDGDPTGHLQALLVGPDPWIVK